MSGADPMLASLARDLRLLTRGLAAELAFVVPVRRCVPECPAIVAIGSVDRVGLEVAQVLRPVLTTAADALVLAHNHQVGQGPSPQDLAFTRRVVAAAAVVGVAVRAHLVLLPDRWVDCLHDADATWRYPEGSGQVGPVINGQGASRPATAGR